MIENLLGLLRFLSEDLLHNLLLFNEESTDNSKSKSKKRKQQRAGFNTSA
jgi:hypothetical protein